MIGALTGNVSQLIERIADVDGNRLLDTDGRWYGFFKLEAVSYDMMPESAKLELHRNYTNALGALANGRFKILCLSRDFNWESYVERSKHVSKAAAKMPQWLEWNDAVADRVGTRTPFEREAYLSVPLDEPSFAGGFLDDITRAAEFANQYLQGLLGDEPEDGNSSQNGSANGHALPEHVRRAPRSGARLAYTPLDRAEAIERSEAVSQLFAAVLAPDNEQPREEDVARLVLRMSTYGLGEPEALGLSGPGNVSGWKPRVIRPVADGSAPQDGASLDERPYEPDFDEMRELLGNCRWEAQMDKLVFYWGSGRISYARFLKIKNMPAEGLHFPDHEWAMLPFAANMLLDGEVKEAHAAERERKKDAQRLDEQVKHIHESGAKVPLKLRRAEKAQDRIEAQFAANQPLIKMRSTIWVFASSPGELDVRTGSVQRYFEHNFSIRTVVPGGNQIECFADFLPAGPRALSGYTQPMPPETAAGSMAPGTTQVGDGGPYIGYTRRTRAIVGRAAEQPMANNKSGTTVWVGEPGSGKSVGAYFDVARDALRGVPSLILDSKGDARNIKNIPELSGAVEEYRVEPNSDTRLPIMRIYPLDQPGETLSLLTTFLTTALMPPRQASMKMHQALRWSANDHVDHFVASGGTRKMSQLRDSFRACAERFSHLADEALYCADEVDRLIRPSSLASLALADDAEDGDVLHRTVGDGLITVILTHGLKLPAYGQPREEMSEGERIAEGIQSVVAASAWRMAATDRMDEYKLFKRLVFEEAWRTLQNEYGQALIKSVDRESRMLRLVCDIITQRGYDLGDTLKLATTTFVGRNTDEEDAARLLQHMKVEPDPELIAFVGRQRDGQFIMQDYQQRAAAMQVDVVPGHWLPILDTTPKDRPEDTPEPPGRGRPERRDSAYAGTPA